jgi:hypothetical protein
LKHNKREKKKAFAQGLTGGKRCRRTSSDCPARKNAKIPEVVKVNNYQKYLEIGNFGMKKGKNCAYFTLVHYYRKLLIHVKKGTDNCVILKLKKCSSR